MGGSERKDFLVQFGPPLFNISRILTCVILRCNCSHTAKYSLTFYSIFKDRICIC